MRTLFCFLGLLCGILFSCSNKKSAKVREINLEFEQLIVNGLMIGKSSGMLLVDSNLLIADKQSDSLFHLVNLNTLTSKEVGRLGQGPREYLHFDNFYSINSEYGFYDKRLGSVNRIIFSEGRIRFEKGVRNKSKNYRLVPTKFDTFIGIGPYEKGLFNILDSLGGDVKMVGEQPYRDDDERKIPELFRSMAYQGNIVISPDGKRLIHAIFMSPIISFYKLSPTSVELVKSYADCYPKYRPESNGKSYASAMSRSNLLGYVNVAVSNKFVYALLSGKSTKEYGLSAFTGDKIRVYDWDGNLIKEMKCNVELSAICVSSDDSKIYGVGLMDDYELLRSELD